LLTPSGTDVVFSEEGGLSVVPVAGGSPPLSFTGSVFLAVDPQVPRDERRVVFHSISPDYPPLVPSRVYSAPIDGSASPLDLSGPLVSGGSVYYHETSQRGDRVVFSGDKEVDGRSELYSVPIDGRGVPAKLNGELVAGGQVRLFEISPGGRRVVYTADQELPHHVELYSVLIDGAPRARAIGGPALPGRVKLNGPLPAGDPVSGDVGVDDFVIDPSGTSVAFTVVGADGEVQIFGVPVDHRTEPALLGAGLSDVNSIVSSPDHQRVVYSATTEPASFHFRLFSVPADGSLAPVELGGPFVTGGLAPAVIGGFFEVSADSRWVVYMADQDVDERV